ncbi:hypothetical protein THIX_70208 [Thiomonas sp. X19]|uniref:hypothetical protein n=1 Tax=Thiomonas sp. X19 TaxID=1050370 RepID=UPI000B6FE246|nr:hypothetical protein [Thiomonas sp. X19]SCC95179.1 hypothetical protein THIX_70208 [Thiomonas sp. X19]
MKKISSVRFHFGTEERRNGDFERAAIDAAGIIAEGLLSQLAPLFVAVAAAAKNEYSARAWVDAWALQIAITGLTDAEVEAGIRNLRSLDQNQILNWPTFYALCRPKYHPEHQPAKFPELPDPTKKERIDRARRAAVAKLCARGWMNR